MHPMGIDIGLLSSFDDTGVERRGTARRELCDVIAACSFYITDDLGLSPD